MQAQVLLQSHTSNSNSMLLLRVPWQQVTIHWWYISHNTIVELVDTCISLIVSVIQSHTAHAQVISRLAILPMARVWYFKLLSLLRYKNQQNHHLLSILAAMTIDKHSLSQHPIINLIWDGWLSLHKLIEIVEIILDVSYIRTMREHSLYPTNGNIYHLLHSIIYNYIPNIPLTSLRTIYLHSDAMDQGCHHCLQPAICHWCG